MTRRILSAWKQPVVRAELFHSNPVKDRTKIYRACERILDCLGLHLGDFDADVGDATYVRTQCTIVREERHLVPAR